MPAASLDELTIDEQTILLDKPAVFAALLTAIYINQTLIQRGNKFQIRGQNTNISVQTNADSET